MRVLKGTYLLIALFILIGTSCANAQEVPKEEERRRAETLLSQNIKVIAEKVQTHLLGIDEQTILPKVPKVQCFVDITDDGVPEFLWGHGDGSNSGIIWVHGYSLTEHRDILATHSGDAWFGSPCGDETEESVALFTINDNDTFPLEGQCYIEDSGQKYYIAHSAHGSATYPYTTADKLWQDRDGWKVESTDVPSNEFELPKDKSIPIRVPPLREIDLEHIEDSISSCLADYFDEVQ